MGIRERAGALKRDIPAIYMALRDAETPLAAKLLAGVTVAYALSPLDLVPDFIPVLGYLDDLLILPLLAALTIRLIPKPVWERSREKAAGLWRGGRPKRWYFAIPVVLLWLAVAGALLRAFLR